MLLSDDLVTVETEENRTNVPLRNIVAFRLFPNPLISLDLMDNHIGAIM